MNRILRWGALALLAITLCVDLAAWAGVRRTDAVGPVVLRSAQKEAPIVLAYMHAGDALLGAVGLGGWAQAYAARRFGHIYPAVLATPEAAVDVLFGGMSLAMRTAHAAPPWLALAALLIWLLRPRHLKTFGRR